MRFLVKSGAAIALLAGLGACEAPITALDTPFDPNDEMLLAVNTGSHVRPMEASAYFVSEQAFVELLDALEAPANANVRARANQLLHSPSDKLAGLGGTPARSAIFVGLGTLSEGAGNFDSDELREIHVTGEIMNWSPDVSEVGFYYRPGEPMHIWVKMTTVIIHKTKPTKYIGERYRVEIPAAAMGVEEAEADANGVLWFPDFSGEAFRVEVPASNPSLRWKLWAYGTAVKVTDYGIRHSSYGAWHDYTEGSAPANYKNIFESEPDSCFDMLFPQDPRDPDTLPDGQLPSDWRPPMYCLGRCTDPPIVNTGA